MLCTAAQMRSCHLFPHLVQLKKSVMPSSVLAEKNTASLCPHASHATSLVLGSVGSALTSCRMTVFSLEVCVISFLHDAAQGHDTGLALDSICE